MTLHPSPHHCTPHPPSTTYIHVHPPTATRPPPRHHVHQPRTTTTGVCPRTDPILHVHICANSPGAIAFYVRRTTELHNYKIIHITQHHFHTPHTALRTRPPLHPSMNSRTVCHCRAPTHTYGPLTRTGGHTDTHSRTDIHVSTFGHTYVRHLHTDTSTYGHTSFTYGHTYVRHAGTHARTDTHHSLTYGTSGHTSMYGHTSTYRHIFKHGHTSTYTSSYTSTYRHQHYTSTTVTHPRTGTHLHYGHTSTYGHTSRTPPRTDTRHALKTLTISHAPTPNTDTFY